MNARRVVLLAVAAVVLGGGVATAAVAANTPNPTDQGVVIDQVRRDAVADEPLVTTTTDVVPTDTVVPVTTTNNALPVEPAPVEPAPAQPETTATTAPYVGSDGTWVVDYPTNPYQPGSTETAPAPIRSETSVPDPIGG